MKRQNRIFVISFLLLGICLSSCQKTPKQVVKWDTGSVKSADGVKVVYQVAGEGPISIVFVHGWSCDRSYWREQVDYFARNYRVVALDLAGHGDSGLNRNEWTFSAFGQDVAAVINGLGLDRVVLVGHSMGGPVVVEAAGIVPGS